MSKTLIHANYPDFQPMLSGKFKYPDKEIVHLKNFPYITSPKVDGIRCIIGEDGIPYTRKLKPVPNKFTRERIRYLTRFAPILKNLDGELVLGGEAQLTEPNIFQATSSAVMSHEGEPSLTFWYFDYFASPNTPYSKRFLEFKPTIDEALERLNESLNRAIDPHHKIFFRPLPFLKVNSLSELEAAEESAVQQGFEGLMFRNPNKPYKFGRSATTKTQQHLIKLTRWETAEGIIRDTEELQHNDNPLLEDNLGYAKRSSNQEGKVGGNTLGKFIIEVLNGPFKGQLLAVGTGEGLTHSLRQELWNTRDQLPGKVITFKYRAYGSKDLPRFPIFKGFRSISDL